MDSVDMLQLSTALKEVTLNALNELVLHNIKGADIILKGVKEAIACADEVEQHYETLKLILNTLKPVFELAREWLVSCYEHLVALFDWAKEKWHEIFG